MVKSKSSSSKLATSKKSSKAVKSQKVSPYLMGMVWFIAIFSLIVFASWAITSIINANNQARLDRIEAIYAKLQLNSDEYPITKIDVFGDKKGYSADAERTKSSTVQYVHGNTVTETFAELDKKIRDAGFEFVDEPNPSATSKQYVYKSNKNEYLRLTVSSKLYDDAMRNTALMKQDFTAAVEEASKNSNAGPSNITIKVNLDDNNE